MQDKTYCDISCILDLLVGQVSSPKVCVTALASRCPACRLLCEVHTFSPEETQNQLMLFLTYHAFLSADIPVCDRYVTCEHASIAYGPGGGAEALLCAS